MAKGDSRGMAAEARRASSVTAPSGARLRADGPDQRPGPAGVRGRMRLLAGLSAEEEAALRDFEEAESRVTIGPPKIHPLNRGKWPSEEEMAARKREVRKQLERMRREHPRLYERLPLLHELIEPEGKAGR